MNNGEKRLVVTMFFQKRTFFRKSPTSPVEITQQIKQSVRESTEKKTEEKTEKKTD